MSLESKWNPLMPQPEDYEDDNERLIAEDTSEPTEGNPERFNTRITQNTLGDTFRIFCEGARSGATPPDTKNEPEPDEEAIKVYTDGSAINNSADNAQAGTGIYFRNGEETWNRAIGVPSELHPSNQVGEIIAIKETLVRAAFSCCTPHCF